MSRLIVVAFWLGLGTLLTAFAVYCLWRGQQQLMHSTGDCVGSVSSPSRGLTWRRFESSDLKRSRQPADEADGA